jgi:hypothetical protein
LICVDDFNAAKRFSTFAVNTAQRSSTLRNQRISTQFNAEKSIGETILPNRQFLPSNHRLSFTGIRVKCSKLAVDEFKIHQRQPAGETKSLRRRTAIPQPP